MIKKLFFVAIVFLLASCDDLFSPAIENNRGLDSMYDEAEFAQGILLNGYARIPTNAWSFSDVATDDAVSNDKTNGFLKIATGQWTSNNNPLNQWTSCNSAIQYLNIILAEADKVKWAKDEQISTMFRDRIKGEAYGLRALFLYYLLQSHGGWSGGRLLGVPIVLEPDGLSANFDRPRATFEECMTQIYADIQLASELLPLDFEDITSQSMIPQRYPGVRVEDYNRVFGNYGRLRMTARIAKGIKAQAAFLAASPAYNTGNTTTWADAANYAAAVLDTKGGIGGVASNGLTWYSNASEISALQAGANPAEVLWRSDNGESNSLESDHFPPTLDGKGRLNPTQNLVNAFPMANGYPIDHPASGYNAATPYTNRDSRLNLFVVVNGSTAGINSSTINTTVDGTTNDALNKVETSTRTGYYMRKLLRQDVNLNPNIRSTQKHYKPRIRYTELYLIYAEAANEAYGPMGTGAHSYSAYDVVKALRQRAGVTGGDLYLESIKNDKDAMRKLIRNERRLELCFEGFRFWDLRRWNADLNENALGMKIQTANYTTIPVENRVYDSYMNYGPIPYSEILKFGTLAQNAGW